MDLHVRSAEPADVEAVAALSRQLRRRLDGWEPDYWRRADGADELHPLWLGYLVTAADVTARVVTDGDEVVAAAFCLAQPGQWFADDVVVADGRWPDAGSMLLTAIVERPVVTCVAHQDRERADAFGRAGWSLASSYRLLRLDGPSAAGEAAASAGAGAGGGGGGLPDPLEPPPPNSFGATDPAAPGALVIVGATGYLVGSPSVAAPPVYDPGGTTAVVDRVVGADPGALLDGAARQAAARGDVGLVVVCAHGDDRLQAALDERGYGHPVDVLRGPG